MIQKVEHALYVMGHWLILAVTALTYAAEKASPLTQNMHNTIQMAQLVLGAGAVAAIVKSAMVQRALVLAQDVAQGAGAAQQAASLAAGAIQSAQQATGATKS